MENLFNISLIPFNFINLQKGVVIDVRADFLNDFNKDLVLRRLKELNFDFYFLKIEKNENIHTLNKKIPSQYKKNLIFLSDAPKEEIEIDIIDSIEPEKIVFFNLPNLDISIIDYKQFKLKINGFTDIPFSPFSTIVERKFLYNLAKYIDIDGDILEVGAYTGGTTISLGLGNKNNIKKAKIISVDRQFQPSFDYFIKKMNINNDISKIEMTSDLAFNKIFKQNPPKLRILWIDGDHSYNSTKKDLQNYKEFLNDGGILVIHDYGTNPGFHGGIIRAVYEEVILDNRFSNFGLIGSIFYAEKNRNKRFLHFNKDRRFNNSPLYYLEFLRRNFNFEGKKIFLYGAGLHAKEVLKLAKENFKIFYQSINGLIDDYKEGKIFDKNILKLNDLKSLSFDYIIPCSYEYEDTILKKLRNENFIDNKKIINVYKIDEKNEAITNANSKEDNQLISIISDYSSMELLFDRFR